MSTGNAMDRELRAILLVSRHVPAFPHSTAIGNRLLKPFYLRKPRCDVLVDVLDFRMMLDPAEAVDGNLLLHPHLYDTAEVGFLRGHLRPGDVFVDIGANIGFYSLLAARLVGPTGTVLAIEADPYSYDRLVANIELNGLTGVRACQVGVSDREETLRLAVNMSGNRGGSTFLVPGEQGVDVRCEPLLATLARNGIDRITATKLDIEGFEHRVLKAFLQDAPRALLPAAVILEFNESRAEGNPVELLLSHGYTTRGRSRGNYMLELLH